MPNYRRINENLIEYKGVIYRRYPESERRTHRVYYQHHGKWKQPPEFLHRRIYEDNFGPIPKGWHIHHKDGDTENNSPENLEALPQKKHMSITSRGMWGNPEWAEKRRAYYKTEEHRKKTSEAQKRRKETLYKCELCKEEFWSRNNTGHVKYCPECRKMLVYNEYGHHFSEAKQRKRFGRVLEPYEQDGRKKANREEKMP